MNIKTKKFTLRYPSLKDTYEYWKAHQDPAARKNLREFPRTLKDAKREIREAMRNNRRRIQEAELFIIDVENEVAGFIELHHMKKGHKASIAYMIAKGHRGKGIATAAVKAMTRHAFSKHRLHRVDAYVRKFNKASAHVLEKAGYKLEGTLKKNTKVAGKFIDHLLYAKVR